MAAKTPWKERDESPVQNVWLSFFSFFFFRSTLLRQGMKFWMVLNCWRPTCSFVLLCYHNFKSRISSSTDGLSFHECYVYNAQLTNPM